MIASAFCSNNWYLLKQYFKSYAIVIICKQKKNLCSFLVVIWQRPKSDWICPMMNWTSNLCWNSEWCKFYCTCEESTNDCVNLSINRAIICSAGHIGPQRIQPYRCDPWNPRTSLRPLWTCDFNSGTTFVHGPHHHLDEVEVFGFFVFVMKK